MEVWTFFVIILQETMNSDKTMNEDGMKLEEKKINDVNSEN